MAGLSPVSNESEASFSRTTCDGRNITYQMRVLQQPERARACGSGAKSSADRRPVDPPPVIELKIFEGHGDRKTDITFHHKANFFIFTTLEAARQIAPMRGQPNTQPPVLTGQPVSGAALLDRPSPAAYFIFPDLSVRHEGKYRLSFNLYEELKDAKDDDAPNMPGSSHAAAAGGLLNSTPMLGQAHVHFRMDVRSKPFTVYSAKKFPGLTESTSLSRVVAEQGCRVRIRRDVRMRRRDTKGSKDSDHEDSGYGGYSEPVSAGGAASDHYRHSSVEHSSPAAAEQGYYSSSSSSYHAPPTIYAAPPPPPAAAHQQQQQHHHHQQAVPQPYPRPSSSHQQYSHPTAAGPAIDASASMPTNVYGQQYTAYSTPQTAHTRHPSVASSHESLLQSYQAGAVTSPQTQPQPHAQPQQQLQVQHAHPPPPPPLTSYGQLPPEPFTRPSYEIDTATGCNRYFDDVSHRSVLVDTSYANNAPAYPAVDPRAATANSSSLPPLNAVADKTDMHSSPQPARYSGVPDLYSAGGDTKASMLASIRAGNKRAYDRSFNAELGASMANGSRPDGVGQDLPQIATEEEGNVDFEELMNSRHLLYRRANGSLQTKKIPSPSEAYLTSS